MRGNWRALISTEADRLCTELPSASSSHDQATVKHAANLLDQVKRWEKQPKSLREWWTGEGFSRAWLQLREAEAELAATLPDEIALCRLPEALADARRQIGDDDDPAIREATSLYFETYGGVSSIGRPAHRCTPQVLARLLRRCCAVVFEREARSLTLRNRIFRVIVVTIVILVVLVWITAAARLHWAPEANTTKVPAFPSAWLTLLCVITFGVLGGLISAIPVLARPRRRLTRTDSPCTRERSSSLSGASSRSSAAWLCKAAHCPA